MSRVLNLNYVSGKCTVTESPVKFYSRPVIGSRYSPEHVMRFDSLTGTYEEVNSPITSPVEARVQQALLSKLSARRRLPVAWLCYFAVVLLVAVVACAQVVPWRAS